MLKIRRKHGTNRNSWEAITRQLAGVEHSRSDRTLSVPESGIKVRPMNLNFSHVFKEPQAHSRNKILQSRYMGRGTYIARNRTPRYRRKASFTFRQHLRLNMAKRRITLAALVRGTFSRQGLRNWLDPGITPYGVNLK